MQRRTHAAALFWIFFERRGARLVADHGRIPARSGVKPKFETLNQLASGAVPIQVITPEDAQRRRPTADRLLKEILLRR